ncbi:MAG: SRPBCC family protein [Planctomycetaceae bacterium]|nr:SRPBCC family protein [Planctomycetales bacterium]MCB9921874.1 SRPBCC family protein [Planctomycetaceae bacterium]
MSITIGKQPSSRGYCLTTELRVPEARDRVFEFFADAYQLEAITPPWLHFSVLTPRPIEMCPGRLIDYRLRLHGVPIRWRSKISDWQPPFQFVDEQLKGPYHYWHHQHTFEEVSDGTLVRDVVNYAVPLGFILHPLLVRRDLTRIFEFRRDALGSVFTPIGCCATARAKVS